MSQHTDEADRPFTVCPTCQGHGSHGPGFVYTQDDREELGDEFYDIMENHRAGLYDVTCTECGGRRVVRKECACPECEHQRRLTREAEAERRAELRMGC